MTKISATNEEIREIDDYLKGYALNEKLIKLDKYERKFLGFSDPDETPVCDAILSRARMFEIRHFIMDMKNSDEKLFLYYHYIRNETVEKCAELLGISRSSGFRLKRRALSKAAEIFKNRPKNT